MWSAWVFASLYFPALQVAPLYLWYNQPRSQTVYQRIAAPAVAAGMAGWVPTARRLLVAGGSGNQVGSRPRLVDFFITEPIPCSKQPADSGPLH